MIQNAHDQPVFVLEWQLLYEEICVDSFRLTEKKTARIYSIFFHVFVLRNINLSVLVFHSLKTFIFMKRKHFQKPIKEWKPHIFAKIGSKELLNIFYQNNRFSGNSVQLKIKLFIIMRRSVFTIRWHVECQTDQKCKIL